MTETLRWKLPLIAAGQAQKHVTANEALTLLSVLAGIIPAESRALTGPPAGTIADGRIWIVAGSGTGEWAGFQAGDLAVRIDGNWRRILPEKGALAAVADEADQHYTYDGATWVAVDRGEAGVAGLRYDFNPSTNTAANAGPGNVWVNHASLPSATELAIADQDGDGIDQSGWIGGWAAADNPVRGHIILRKLGVSGAKVVYRVTGDRIDEAGWSRFPVAFETGGGLAGGDQLDAVALRAGDRGPQGNPGNVSSQEISTIKKLTQAEYDALGAPDPATLYVIVG